MNNNEDTNSTFRSSEIFAPFAAQGYTVVNSTVRSWGEGASIEGPEPVTHTDSEVWHEDFLFQVSHRTWAATTSFSRRTDGKGAHGDEWRQTGFFRPAGEMFTVSAQVEVDGVQVRTRAQSKTLKSALRAAMKAAAKDVADRKLAPELASVMRTANPDRFVFEASSRTAKVGDLALARARGKERVGIVTKVTKTKVEVAFVTPNSPGMVSRKSFDTVWMATI